MQDKTESALALEYVNTQINESIARNIFGKDCDVEHLENGGMRVKNVLKSGYCKGGQQLEVVLYETTKKI